MKPAVIERARESESAAQRSSRPEPQTGVVRKAVVPEAVLSRAVLSEEGGSQPDLSVDGEPRRSRSSRIIAKSRSSASRPSLSGEGWRCLDWPEPPQKPAATEPLRASVAQVDMDGRVLRHSGPHAWLPEAGEFVHRLALLVAQGLGFDRCRAATLRGTRSVLSVSEAGPSRIVAVTGPSDLMNNVLEKSGLE